MGELLTETPLCPELWQKVLELLVWERPQGTNGCCSAQGGNAPEMVLCKVTAHLEASQEGTEGS